MLTKAFRSRVIGVLRLSRLITINDGNEQYLANYLLSSPQWMCCTSSKAASSGAGLGYGGAGSTPSTLMAFSPFFSISQPHRTTTLLPAYQQFH